jgi:hypothetical protein
MLSVVMLSVIYKQCRDFIIMTSVTMLSVVMLNVIIPNALAPQ